MAFRTSQSWTFWGLIGAFVDLALAYFLLCGSAFAYFASKFCNFFGLGLPCPCTGFFGYQNSNICLHRLLVDLPVRKIGYVQMLIKCKFPFHLIWFEDQPCNLEMVWRRDRNYDNGVLELENEVSSSSFSSPKLKTLVDRERGFDAKGKKIVNQKQKNGIRRRRRSSLGHGKSSTVVDVAGSSGAPYNGSDMSSHIGDYSSPIYGKQDVLQDDGNAAIGLDLGKRTWHDFELDVSFVKNKVKENDLSSIDKFVCSAQSKSENAGNEENMIIILKKALEEEKAACAALQLELEKERAAAATATDEAMAMILRLQADKASIEMEARQYERMIEEKFEYEEEEMNIMKEILFRRERENHFLEKEVESYRQMKSFGNAQSEVDFSFLISEWGQKPLHSLDSNEYLMEIEKGKSFDKNKVEKAANLPPSYEASSAEITSEASQTCHENEKIVSSSGEKFGKVEEHETKICSDLQCPKFDSEPIVYDVHVIDDKTELVKEENGKEDRLSNCVALDSGGSSSEVLSDCTSSRVAETNQNNHKSFELKDGIPVLDNSQSKNLPSDLDRNSSSASSVKRSKIDFEVESLRERLRIVRDGKEKLTFSADHREIINAQLKLVEEIVNQLEQFQLLREPTRQASLPPSSSKSKVGLNLKKRRCRSVPSEGHDSS